MPDLADRVYDAFDPRASCLSCGANGHWSHMECWTPGEKPDFHTPHVWNSGLMTFGPYKCDGHPFQPPLPFEAGDEARRSP